jgi:adenylosuccinate lyase
MDTVDTMDSHQLAISPLDGRYHGAMAPLRKYFSEYALMRERYFLELNYLEFFLQLTKNINVEFDKSFDEVSFKKIKSYEKETNHDVKAVEYYIRDCIDASYHNFIHFGLTSHDINNVSYMQNIKNANNKVMLPQLEAIRTQLRGFHSTWNALPMLAHTHGQPATPTTLGKEMAVFVGRLSKQMLDLEELAYYVKFGGAVGNLNAHCVSIPSVDWPTAMTTFMQTLGFKRDVFTTQITNYDDLSKMLSIFQRINTILIDMCQDIWLYISMGYFKLKVVALEVGSSTMPHKVNPIQFENAEGNLGLANSLIQHLQVKLPVSRMQRDLTDSTVMRNIGTVYGYMLQSYTSIQKGFERLSANEEKIASDLSNNYVVVAEAIQTCLKLDPNMTEAYEKLKDFCRNTSKILGKEDFDVFIDGLNISDKQKTALKSITPHNYFGYV